MAPAASARYHGKNARLYVGVTSAAAASPVAYQASFTIDSATDRSDATAFGDANKKALAGLPGGSGTASGWSDIAGDAFYTASVDGLARKTYFYPDFANSPGTYFFTTANWDMNLSVAVGATASISGNWSAETDLIRVLAS
jgi:hypothetical protein